MTALVQAEKGASAPVVTEISPNHLLQIAVQQNADMDKLDKLMTLQERYEANIARKAFASALSGFQSELSPIIKRKQAHNSKYADIDDIAQAIRPIMMKYELSFKFEEDQSVADWISVTCTVSHASGHSESNKLSAPFDKSGGKNLIQAIASTVTYLRRYTLTGALGITTGEDDNDGGKPSVTTDELLQYNTLVRNEYASIAAIKDGIASGDFASAKEAWNELGEQTMRLLWKAPTKGGIFTTKEREAMHSPEWTNA
jgi:hypothetical protein